MKSMKIIDILHIILNKEIQGKQNADGSICFKCEFSANEIDENDLQNEKYSESGQR
jgi:hypothetical protein